VSLSENHLHKFDFENSANNEEKEGRPYEKSIENLEINNFYLHLEYKSVEDE